MKQRTIAALIALPLVLTPLWLGGVWWVGLISLVATLGGYEFYDLMRQGGYQSVRWLGLVWLLLLIFHNWQPQLLPLSLVLTTGFITTLIYSLYQTHQPMTTWAITCIGAIYVGMMLGQALALRLVPEGLWWMLLALFITWANDTMAYLTGVTLGRHKLWPRLSPKKSWEGTIGGWVFATIVGGLVTRYSPLPGSFWLGAGIGLGGGILALFGDLSISMLKRQVGAKDSGLFLPGHGGMLDRLDSLLFVIPFVHQVMLFVTR